MKSDTQETLVLSIEGMHCEACVRRVSHALEQTDGVQVNSVEVGSAQLIFHPPQVSAEEIFAALNQIGFVASVKRVKAVGSYA